MNERALQNDKCKAVVWQNYSLLLVVLPQFPLGFSCSSQTGKYRTLQVWFIGLMLPVIELFKVWGPSH